MCQKCSNILYKTDGMMCKVLLCKSCANKLNQNCANYAILANKNVYCTGLHILHSFVHNFGMTWFADDSDSEISAGFAETASIAAGPRATGLVVVSLMSAAPARAIITRIRLGGPEVGLRPGTSPTASSHRRPTDSDTERVCVESGHYQNEKEC